MALKRRSIPLSITNPELINEWDFEKNPSLSPDSVFPGSHIKVWWKDTKGHSWQAQIADRTRGRGCPYCSNHKVLAGYNDLQTTNSNLIEEWDFSKNVISPNEISAGCHKKVWWKCSKGHEWQSTIYNRAENGSGCPICKNESKTSFPEQAILFYLSKYFKTYSRYKFNNREIDIYIPELMIGVEYDGGFYHRTEKSQRRDKEKQDYLESNGVRIIRIKEGDNNTLFGDVITFKYTAKLSELYWAINKLLSLIDNEKSLDVDLDRDRQEIFSQFIFIEKLNSIVTKYPKIAAEWNYDKNGTVKPDAVSYASNKKFWWKCSQGHEWQAAVSWRTEGNGCPYCSNQRVKIGYNDLLTTNPVLSKEWHPSKNGTLAPNNVTPHSRKKVWWMCEKGHEWQATIDSRNINKCPYCSGRKLLTGFNDLATTNPSLASEWDYNKNNGISPQNVSANSHKKVWWICSKCNYNWISEINNRNCGRSCPICARKNARSTNIKTRLRNSGSLSVMNPVLAKEWDFKKNNPMTPEQVTPGSNKKAWWLCSKCSFSWYATIGSRKAGNGCPRCHGRIPKRVKCIETDVIYDNSLYAAASIGKSRSLIEKCCSGKLKTAGGYHWIYLEH